MESRGRIRSVPTGAEATRVPPNDLDAERAVIGAMLVSEAAVSVVGETLAAEDFYSETHRVLYGAMMRLYSRGEPIDQITLTNELRGLGELDRIGGRPYVFRLVESVPTAANAARYAEMVRGKALLRAVIDAGSRIQQEAFDEPDDVMQALDAAEQLIYGVSNRQLKEHLAPVSELAPGALEMIQRLYEQEGEVTGVESGFEDLDQKTTGFHKSDLVILAARPAMGKTALALNVIWHAAGVKGLPVAIFSLEMSKEQLVQRLISQTTRIRTQDLRSGNVKAEDWPKLVRGVAEVSRAPIWIDDSAGIGLMEMRAKVRRLASRLSAQASAGEDGVPLSMVVIDYLQLMMGANRENRQQEIAEISRGLKVLARDLNVPVLAIAQLSRAVEQRHDKRPLLSDLRDSGCLPASTRISRADNGQEVTLGELVLSQQQPDVWSVDDQCRLVPARLTRAFPTGIKPVYRLTLASGLEIDATANHPFLTVEGWARLDSLDVNGFVAVPRRLPRPVEKEAGWKDDELVLLAHLLGDGSIGPSGVKYATADPANKEAVEETARTLFGIEALTEMNGNTYQVWLPSPYRLTHGKRHPVRGWLEPYGLWGSRSWNKFVPETVFGLDDQKLALFFRHLWSTDGSITISRNGRGPTVSTYYSSTSRRLVLDVKRMLLRFGIRSAFGKTTTERGGGAGSYRASYNLRIQGAEDQAKFLRRVGCHGARGEKINQALEILSALKSNPNVDLVPWEVRRKVSAAMAEKGVSGPELAGAIGETYNGGYLLGTPERRRRFSRPRLAHMASVLESEELANIARSDLYWDRIVEITPLGEQPTFDVTVEGTHNFIADGVVVHNSIEQDADMVMFLYRDEYYNPDSDDKGIAEVIIGKHRNGPTGKVQLAWLEQYTKFASLARR
ncbi:replicative DNA helicase [soil metagenome]